MARFGLGIAALILLAACGGAPDTHQTEARKVDAPSEAYKVSAPREAYKIEAPPEAYEVETPAEAYRVSTYAELDEFGGQFITLKGKFMIHPKYRGKHGLIVMDSGLKVYLPHIDQWYLGDDWYRFEGQRVQVGGILHSYVKSPIDGMPGPYLDEVTQLQGAP